MLSYSLDIEPKEHFLNWQQDPHSNFLARVVVPEKTNIFSIKVGLVAEMAVYNPFDFFLEPTAEKFPFEYDARVRKELEPYLETEDVGPLLAKWIASVDRTPRRTIDFLVEINQRLQQDIGYVIRHGSRRAELRGDPRPAERLVPGFVRGSWSRSCAISASRPGSSRAI